MTYENRELSPYNSGPVELYEFSYATKIWRYTSADEDQTYLSQVFKTLPISRGDIEQTQEMNRSDMQIELPEDVDIADEFEIYPPAEVMLVRIYRRCVTLVITVFVHCDIKNCCAQIKITL